MLSHKRRIVKAFRRSVNQTNSGNNLTLPRFVHYAHLRPPNYRACLPLAFWLRCMSGAIPLAADHDARHKMNRLTLRSRRVVLYVVCSVAVMLGAIGKSMFDQLAEPDINIDPGVSNPALPSGLSRLQQLPQMPRLPQLSHSTSAAPMANAGTGHALPHAVQLAPDVVAGSVAGPAVTAGTTIADTHMCSAGSAATGCTNARAHEVRHDPRKSTVQASHARSDRREAYRPDKPGKGRGHAMSSSQGHKGVRKLSTEDPMYGHHLDHH